jgi:hypothetical protein
MKFYKTLGLTLCCLLGLVACKKDNVNAVNNIEYYEEKAIDIAVERYKEEFKEKNDRYEEVEFILNEIQVINLINKGITTTNKLICAKFDVYLFVAYTEITEFKDYTETENETEYIFYTDIEVPIESEYIEEA